MVATGKPVLCKNKVQIDDKKNKFCLYNSVGEHFNPNNSLHGDPEDDLSKRV